MSWTGIDFDSSTLSPENRPLDGETPLSVVEFHPSDHPTARFDVGPGARDSLGPQLDAEGSSATSDRGPCTLGAGDSFLVDPPYDSAPSTSGPVDILALSGEDECSNSGGSKLSGMNLQMPGEDVAGRCKLAHAQWNTAASPDGSTVTFTEFEFNTSNLNDPEERSSVTWARSARRARPRRWPARCSATVDTSSTSDPATRRGASA